MTLPLLVETFVKHLLSSWKILLINVALEVKYLVSLLRINATFDLFTSWVKLRSLKISFFSGFFRFLQKSLDFSGVDNICSQNWWFTSQIWYDNLLSGFFSDFLQIFRFLLNGYFDVNLLISSNFFSQNECKTSIFRDLRDFSDFPEKRIRISNLEIKVYSAHEVGL